MAGDAAPGARSLWVTELRRHFQQRVEQLFRGLRLEGAGAEPGLVVAPFS